MNSFGSDKGVTIRLPSTANLMIDSVDRADSDLSPFDFQLTRTNSIMNGFFTRIATTELVLEWCETNVNSTLGDTIVIDLSGSGANTFAGQEAVTLNSDIYTVAQALNCITGLLNDLSGTTGMTFFIDQPPQGGTFLKSTGGVFTIVDTDLSERLGLYSYTPLISDAGIDCPDLRPYRYIDFVCLQLTYNQDLKDNATNEYPRDVLARWYFGYDEQNIFDEYGFPILMGYTQFVTRRLFNPPKQIKWSPSQPLGNMAFNVYDDEGNQIPNTNAKTNWLMTLQFSET